MASSANERLRDAARDGDLAGIAAALLAGADPNAFEGTAAWTPLLRAANKGHVAAIAALLAAGARVDGVNSNGTAPHMSAAWNGNIAAIDVLLAAGADVNHANVHGDTAVHLASMRGHADAARVLVEAGARADVRSNNGKQPVDVVRAPLARSMRLRVRVTMLRRHVAVRRRASTATSPPSPPCVHCWPTPPPGPAAAPWLSPATGWSGSGRRKRGRLAVVDV
jgi:hypothetical protein